MHFFFKSDCNCNTDGTEGGDETCDSETGQCHCKCDVTGDKCDTCTPYHHGFPDCHGKFSFLSKNSVLCYKWYLIWKSQIWILNFQWH